MRDAVTFAFLKGFLRILLRRSRLTPPAKCCLSILAHVFYLMSVPILLRRTEASFEKML